MIVFALALTCAVTWRDDVRSGGAQAQALIEDAQKWDAWAAYYHDQQTQIRAAIAKERTNPAGVVDLVRLHDLGEELQIDADREKDAKASSATDMKQATAIVAHIKSVATACK
jgi:hypothetical protein